MNRILLTSRRLCLHLSPSRGYLPSVHRASARMVSTKKIAVCDEDSLKDGEMSVALIADTVFRFCVHVSFHTLTQLAGRKSILAVGKFCCPRLAIRSTQQARTVPITGHRWSRVSSLQMGESYGSSTSHAFCAHPWTDFRVAHGTEVYPSSSFQPKSLTTTTRSMFQRLHRRHRRCPSASGHPLLQNQHFRWENLRYRRRRTCLESKHVASAQGPLKSGRWVDVRKRRCRHRRRWEWGLPLRHQFA